MKKLILVFLLMCTGYIALGSPAVEGVDGKSGKVRYVTQGGKGNWRIVVIEDKK